MDHRPLGRTGVRVSVLAFGAGPVSDLMTGADAGAQAAVVRRAIDAGVNWFDTAPGYGQGQSEANLGRALRELGASGTVHVATKVRIPPDGFGRIDEHVRRSVAESLGRLELPGVTLLQLHNGITAGRGDEPSSITPDDVLGPGGVREAFERLRAEGLVRHLGLTGTGHPEALREVVRSGAFDAIQIPYHLLNPSAGRPIAVPGETDHGNLIADCADQGMGVLAIRVFAAGALLGQPPSAHTLKTPYFPLDLYDRDRLRAARLAASLGADVGLKELALRFALSHPAVHSAIVGFGAPEHIDEAAAIVRAGPLPADWLARLDAAGGPS